MPPSTAAEESFGASVDRMVDRALAHVNLPPGLAREIKAVNSVLQLVHTTRPLNEYATKES